jgi:hypothetical protein
MRNYTTRIFGYEMLTKSSEFELCLDNKNGSSLNCKLLRKAETMYMLAVNQPAL